MAIKSFADRPEAWPELPLKAWIDTYATLHMWTQIVGKVRTALSPLVNHWWSSTLYVTARGLTTSPIPYAFGTFEVTFDFIDHRLNIETSRGEVKTIPLVPRTVADFLDEFMKSLKSLGIEVKIWDMPVEIPRPVRFNLDREHSAYDREYAGRFFQILVSVDSVFKEFRSTFIGKVSPVHFFWGSFDLAVTLFSGKRSPARPDADAVTREAYSHEVISVGFWPGGGPVDGAAFYAYAAPEPSGFSDRRISPAKAFYDPKVKEFFLMYDDVRAATSPREAVLAFCRTTYDAAADLAGWDRKELERQA